MSSRIAFFLLFLFHALARVGLLAIGHTVYWPQFEGLLDEMRGADVRIVVLHHPWPWLAEHGAVSDL